MKTSHGVVVVLFAVVALLGFNLLGQDAKQVPQQRWEYLMERHSYGMAQQALKKNGETGWELVEMNVFGGISADTHMIYLCFQRPVK